MKKLLFILSLLIIENLSFAQVKVGSNGNIIATGHYPVANGSDIKGTLHFFQTIVQRNALPSNFRDTGMLAYVGDSAQFYYLNNSISNSAWTLWQGGGSGCAMTYSMSADSLYKYYIDCHGDTLYTGYILGDITGGGGSSTDNWDSTLLRQTTPISADRTVDFGGHNMIFKNSNSYELYNGADYTDGYGTDLYLGNDAILSYSDSAGYSANVKLYKGEEADSSIYDMISAQSGSNFSTIFLRGSLNNDRNYTTIGAYAADSSSEIKVNSNLISFSSSGITNTNVKFNGLDSSNANPNNIAWFDNKNMLHRGYLATGGGGGSVTGVTASAPLASSGGTSPNITADTTTAITGLGTKANFAKSYGVGVSSYTSNASKDSTIITLNNGTRYAVRDSVSGVNFNNGLVSTGAITLVDSTLTINAPIIWKYKGVTYTKATASVFTINTASAGYYRTDLIYADSTGALTKVVGTQDTAITSPPSYPSYGIQVLTVSIYGATITPPSSTPSSNFWQITGNSLYNDSAKLGTTNNYPVHFYVNNGNAANLKTNGAGSYEFDVLGQTFGTQSKASLYTNSGNGVLKLSGNAGSLSIDNTGNIIEPSNNVFTINASVSGGDVVAIKNCISCGVNYNLLNLYNYNGGTSYYRFGVTSTAFLPPLTVSNTITSTTTNGGLTIPRLTTTQRDALTNVYVQVNTGGAGYTSAPTVNISGGNVGATPGTGIATIISGAVVGVAITGGVYSTLPTITLTGGGYTTAATITPVFNYTVYDGTRIYNTDTKRDNHFNLTYWVVDGGFSGSYSTTASSTSTFTVTIGTTLHSTTYPVTVTPTSSLGAAPFYVTNKTTTTFDVVYLTALTGTQTFDWIIPQQ